jgi:hypothetical protein
MATVKMRKGDLFADIYDSPETVSQARREGYSLVEAEDIEKTADINELTKNELIELARKRGVYQKCFEQLRKAEIIEKIKAAGPASDKPARTELIEAAKAAGFNETDLDGLSDDELASVLAKKD